MRDYETQRQQHLDRAMSLAPEMIDRLGWPAYALAARRVQLLRELVREAIARSPWHRDRLAGMDLDQLDEMSLRELPPMTKTPTTGFRLSSSTTTSRRSRRGAICSTTTPRSRRAARPGSVACSSTTGMGGRRSG
jgi:hypothetical protein